MSGWIGVFLGFVGGYCLGWGLTTWTCTHVPKRKLGYRGLCLVCGQVIHESPDKSEVIHALDVHKIFSPGCNRTALESGVALPPGPSLRDGDQGNEE